ncbi:membrane protein [Alphaproteobacteria bacterium]|nr:membrane protein [Alphaproteobacteria bacterium]
MKFFRSLFLSALFLLCASGLLSAGERPRFSVLEENDKFASRDDRDYTQGIVFSYVTPDISGDWSLPFDQIGSVLPIFRSGGKRKYAFELGQSIFTPTDTESRDYLPGQRPYAAWSNVGISLMQEQGNLLETLELQLGVVGPAALGRQAQNGWHRIIDVDRTNGWRHQIKNEPGLVLSYGRKGRFGGALGSGLAFDAIPEVGFSLGNVFTYAQGGILFRLGQNIDADYGPIRNRPHFSGSGWFDEDRMDGGFGWYLFAGANGRAVARNIALDGNSWKDSPSIGKEPFVGDIVFGASIYWSANVRLDLSVTHRSREYKGQADTDSFGSIGLSFGL